MAIRKTTFAINEWYHCYNRGVDKRTVFYEKHDYHRFLEQLYLANSKSPLRRDNIRKRKFSEVLQTPRDNPLVAIGSFCLMPNHYHIVLKEIADGGITKFMQKLGTAYTMYFNTRYGHTGNLFVKPFRSRHVDTDKYFQHLIHYVHCNPAELFEHKWKTSTVQNMDELCKKLVQYPYSSLGAYENINAPTYAILDKCVFGIVRGVPTIQMLNTAQEYYLDNPELP